MTQDGYDAGGELPPGMWVDDSIAYGTVWFTTEQVDAYRRVTRLWTETEESE